MCARTAEEMQRRQRRRSLVRGLLIGGAAVGIPALANALVKKRAGRLPPPRWGRSERYLWRHGEIAFHRLGSGPPLLLLHSLGPGHDAHEWRQVAQALADRYTVYAPDLLGWGRSEKPALTYDGELYIQLVADLLADLVRDRALLVACGLPAAYAVQVAVDEPEMVRGLGLVTPLGVDLHGDEPDFKDAMVHRMLRLPVLGTSALNAYTSYSGITHHLRHEVYAAPDRVDAALIDRHYRASHQPGAHAALAAYVAGYLNHGVEELLSRISVPTWVAWGRKAVSPSVETADLWLRHLDADLHVFEESGILPHAEEPAAFVRSLAEFLEGLPG